MLLHRGHGRILSGFFRVFSWEILVSLCSPFLEDFGKEVSLSAEEVLGFSKMPEDAVAVVVVGDFASSVV